MSHPLGHGSTPTGPKLVVGVIVGVLVIQALMLFAFAWPATNSGPREVPIAVAGPPAVAGQVDQGLSKVPSRDGGTPAFEVISVADEAAATTAIKERDAYGAVVVTPQGPQLLVASGAGPAIAQLLRTASAQLSPGGEPVPVRDVVPLTEDDPTGAGLASGVLPLVMTSAICGFLAALVLRGRGSRLAAVTTVAVAGGFAAAGLLHGLGVTDGSYWALTGVIALTIGAIAASVAGLGAVLGAPGAGLGVLLMIFLGNPLSAAPSAPEMLPQPWGELGQLMPPGAAVTAARSVGFFDSAAIGTPVLVLSIWFVAGLALVAIGWAGLRSSKEASTL